MQNERLELYDNSIIYTPFSKTTCHKRKKQTLTLNDIRTIFFFFIELEEPNLIDHLS